MPIELRSPGLKWRLRWGRHVAYWVCNSKASRAGYPVRTQRLWSGLKPTNEEEQIIRRECHRLQREMKDWLKGNSKIRQPILSKEGEIYFLRAGNNLKIGFSRNIRNRFNSIQTSSPETLELLGVIPGTSIIEKQLHSQFQQNHIRGEWFALDDKLLEQVKNVIGIST